MKGPYQRLRHDLRRLWECPECGRHTRASGDVTFRICPCQKDVKPTKQICMRLIEAPTRRELATPPAPEFRPAKSSDNGGSTGEGKSRRRKPSAPATPDARSGDRRQDNRRERSTGVASDESPSNTQAKDLPTPTPRAEPVAAVEAPAADPPLKDHAGPESAPAAETASSAPAAPTEQSNSSAPPQTNDGSSADNPPTEGTESTPDGQKSKRRRRGRRRGKRKSNGDAPS